MLFLWESNDSWPCTIHIYYKCIADMQAILDSVDLFWKQGGNAY